MYAIVGADRKPLSDERFPLMREAELEVMKMWAQGEEVYVAYDFNGKMIDPTNPR